MTMEMPVQDASLSDEHRRRGRARQLVDYGLGFLTRKSVREHEIGLITLAALLGIASGFGVTVLRRSIAAFQLLAFDVPMTGDLSDGDPLDWWRVLFVPCLGGAIVGLIALWIKRWRPHDIVDAIEANALYGGRMSLMDSFNLGVTTLLSGGFGASVGLEAAYTQLGAAMCSKVGTTLQLRRDDLRTLVGCGAGAAIAAAFNAPLTGAFYAFELVIGTYSLSTLAPVIIATLAGTFTARATFGAEPVFVVDRAVQIHASDYPLFILLGLLTAVISIITMRGVTATQRWFEARSIPPWLRPGIGGITLGTMALIYPQVMGSGHGGIIASLHLDYTLPYLGGLLAAKMAASAISIGSGFRGGLFSSALFLGALVGSAVALAVAFVWRDYPVDELAFTLVGMGSMAAGIIGAPVTMILLVLESTGDLSATTAVLCGVITTSVAVRHWFGYSFATWRFHLRGLAIRSADDIGWLDDLKVGRLMRTDVRTVPVSMTVGAIRKLFPLGSTKRVVALNDGRLAGMLDLTALHGPEFIDIPEDTPVGDLHPELPPFLVPGDGIKTALDRFTEARIEAMPVVVDENDLKVIGYVTESYALRRYNQELERRRGQTLADGPSEAE